LGRFCLRLNKKACLGLDCKLFAQSGMEEKLDFFVLSEENQVTEVRRSETPTYAGHQNSSVHLYVHTWQQFFHLSEKFSS
jgi:hypothetical protein